MEQEILRPWQKEALAFLAKEPALKPFYLTGGTALAAFYLQHRFSDILDFFLEKKLTPSPYTRWQSGSLKPLRQIESTFQKLMIATSFSANLILTSQSRVCALSIFSIRASGIIGGIAVDSEYDIAANKLAAILDRFDPKDFADLYFLLQKYKLEKILDGARKKLGMRVDPIFLGSEFAKARRIAAIPKMLAPLTVEQLKEYFESEAKKLLPKIIEN